MLPVKPRSGLQLREWITKHTLEVATYVMLRSEVWKRTGMMGMMGMKGMVRE